MESMQQKKVVTNSSYLLAGLAGINFIIFIHEMGHFLFSKIFNVPTPSFSLGFGPTLYAFTLGQTTFKLALLPLGGYVEIDPATLKMLSYFPQVLILFGGILFNIIFAYGILLYYRISHYSLEEMRDTARNLLVSKNKNNIFTGPIGIINVIGQSLTINFRFYCFILAILSLNVGLFNCIPLPFLDGGKIIIITIEALMGKTIPATFLWFISTIFLTLFLLLFMRVTINDIKQLVKK